MSHIRVLIVDDHVLVRRGIRDFLATDLALEVAGEAADGDAALLQAESLRPDVILMDLMLPHKDGIQVIAEIRRRKLDVKILVLTNFSDEPRSKAAMQAGADGYLLKDAEGDTLLHAIHAVHQGDMPIHPHVAQHLFKSVLRPKKALNARPLTEREQQVLGLMVKGLNNRTIAQALNLSAGTVKVHVSHIIAKLSVASRTEAAVQAVKLGLATPGEEE